MPTRLSIRARRSFASLVILGAVAAWLVQPAAMPAAAAPARPALRPATPELIERAVRRGEISEAEGALYLTWAFTAPARLPESLRQRHAVVGHPAVAPVARASPRPGRRARRRRRSHRACVAPRSPAPARAARFPRPGRRRTSTCSTRPRRCRGCRSAPTRPHSRPRGRPRSAGSDGPSHRRTRSATRPAAGTRCGSRTSAPVCTGTWPARASPATTPRPPGTTGTRSRAAWS